MRLCLYNKMSRKFPPDLCLSEERHCGIDVFMQNKFQHVNLYFVEHIVQGDLLLQEDTTYTHLMTSVATYII